MRVALIHDWLNGMRGGEYVFEAILELFPEAEVFTLIHEPESVSSVIESRKIHTSFLQDLSYVRKNYRYALPIMPYAIERFDLSDFDIIISSSHCVAKGVRKKPNTFHLSYVHAPMRYIWDRFGDYFGPGKASVPTRLAAFTVRRYLQSWDYEASRESRVQKLIANSHFIASKIQQFYGRDAEVIHPFVNLNRFQLEHSKDDFYLILGAFAPYKRIDLAVEAFNRSGLKLKIAGGGKRKQD